MKYRSVVMYIEIGCFVACVCGWILVCATLPIQYWTYSEVATSVLTNSHTFSNLWKDCMTDLTGMVDCKVFPSLLSLKMYIHLCRATIFTSIVLGFLGAILALIGMKCTKLGGSEITNSKITLAAGMIYLASGLCAMFAFSWYGNKIITEFMDPTHRTKKFELGVALFVGWGGSSLLIIGGLVYSIFGGRDGCEASPIDQEKLVYSTSGAPSPDMLESIQEEEKQPSSPLPSIETEQTEDSEKPLGKAYNKGEYV
ncbi:claudin-10-like isoform X1 [Astyanax mexicanus]|uniref:Claudin-10-like isoform X1 n=1 Tax=Astyanax mexicanus TaxID=7994 RepID=A0A8T2LP51_ASTMX|nr:claudin-10-like isoform X1 [Astyanax mexicanus]